MANTLINVDHGIIPAITEPLKHEYKLDNTALGLLGSVVFFGLTLGSLVAGPAFNLINTKLIILVSWACNGVFLLLFTLATPESYWLMVLSRAATGFF